MSEGLDVTADVDVSVFETNIRLLGGLLSAHLLASDPKLDLYPCPRRDDASFSVNYDGVGVDEGTGERDLEGEGHDERDKGRCFGHGCTDFDAGVDVVDAHDAGADGVGDAVFGGGGSVDRGRGERDDDDDGDDKCEEYKGQLLALAEELGRRLLPAFETPTGTTSSPELQQSDPLCFCVCVCLCLCFVLRGGVAWEYVIASVLLLVVDSFFFIFLLSRPHSGTEAALGWIWFVGPIAFNACNTHAHKPSYVNYKKKINS